VAIETAHSLVEAIRRLDLLDPARTDCLDQLAERHPSPRELARELIQSEWLTPYQVNQLLQDRGQQLVLGPYVLLERLGSGGMGEVFKARHRKLDRIRALKVISRKHLTQAVVVQRFLREAETAAQLSHPNIVAVHDAGLDDDRYYLAMEYIEGIDLGRLLREAGPLPVSLACDFIRQAALGLHQAHEHGLVHRDVKPSNLFVAPRGGMVRGPVGDIERFRGATVKVLDLGLVSQQSERLDETEMALTQKGLVLGTLDYLAPEQARNSHRVDRRADLYSLGCTLFHLVAGQPPFPGGVALDKLLRHQSETPPALAGLRPGVPGRLQAVIERLLAKKPEDRYADANELAVALVPLANPESDEVAVPVAQPVHSANGNGLAATPTPDTQPTPKAEEGGPSSQEIGAFLAPPGAATLRRPPPRRSLWWLAAAGVLAVGLVVGGVGLLVRSAPSNETQPAPPPRVEQRVEQRVDRLANYIPADSAAVVAVKPIEMHRAAIFEGGSAQRALRTDTNLTALLDLLRIDLVRDIDQLRLCVPAGRPRQAQWLARGRFHPDRFPRDGEVLRAEDDPKGPGKMLRYAPEVRPALFLAARESSLLVSPARERARAGLEQASGRTEASVADPTLRKLLAKVDRSQTVWLAVNPVELGPPPRLVRDWSLQSLAEFILRRSSAIHGGVSCGRDLQLHFVLEGHDAAGLRNVVRRLTDQKKRAQTWLFRNTGAPRDQRLWFLVLARTDCDLRGTTLTIRSKVTPGELN
jgi:serine/threonine-protein kinase